MNLVNWLLSLRSKFRKMQRLPMVKMFDHGDIAYVPSSVKIWQTNNSGNPNKTKLTQKPQFVLIADTRLALSPTINEQRKVLLNGEYWIVESKNLYPVQNSAVD